MIAGMAFVLSDKYLDEVGLITILYLNLKIVF